MRQRTLDELVTMWTSLHMVLASAETVSGRERIHSYMEAIEVEMSWCLWCRSTEWSGADWATPWEAHP